MPCYKIEQKITTVAHNAVMDSTRPASFICDNIFFSHGDFNHRDGWVCDYWYASTEIECDSRLTAYNIFREKLMKIIPRVALISQCYISFLNEPFLISRNDEYTDIALFRLIRDRHHVGLMFVEEHKKALDLLLYDNTTPEEFYLYWNDAVNTTGYSSKLLLMFSAIEALSKDRKGKKDWNKIESILGKQLKDEIFTPHLGLRHRLVHGEYFSDSDSNKNYLDTIHKAIIKYFNTDILKDRIIDDNVVHPQRNFFDNKEGGGPWFIRQKPNNMMEFSLKNVTVSKDNLDELNRDYFQIIIGEESKQLNESF